MKLKLVTGNEHKRDEFAAILAGLGCPLDVESLNPGTISETGTTYYQNAYRKARAGYLSEPAAEHEHVIVMADDSGLELPEFARILGVRSARFTYAGVHERAALTAFLRDREVSSTPARFVCWIVVFVPWQEGCFSFEGTVSGIVRAEPEGLEGFGYDPLFVPEGYSLTFAQMDASLKNRISHRAVAAARLWSFVQGTSGL